MRFFSKAMETPLEEQIRHKQLLEAIAALAFGLTSRDSQLSAISQQAAINHEFMVTVLTSLENRIMEMQASQVRWIELYEQKLAAIEQKQAEIDSRTVNQWTAIERLLKKQRGRRKAKR